MRFLPIASLLLCIATPAAAQNAETYKRLVASNTLKANALAERSVTNLGGVVVKEFLVSYGGSVRLKWQLKSDTVDGAVVNVKLANGYAGGQACSVGTASASYVLKTCDFVVSAGDIIQLDLYSNNGQNVALRNARLFFDIVDANKPFVVLTD